MIAVNNYYLTLVLKPDLEEKARAAVLAEVKKKMAGNPSTGSGQAGKLVKEDLWGLRDLSYPIKKQAKGYFAHFEFETEPQIVVDLDKSLKVEEDILRFLLVRV